MHGKSQNSRMKGMYSWSAKTQVTHRRFYNFERMYLENGKREKLVIGNKYVSK